MLWGRLTARYIEDGKNENLLVVLKTCKEVKPHSSEKSEDKVVEGERDKHVNDEHVYYFLMGGAPARSRGWNLGWGWVVGR